MSAAFASSNPAPVHSADFIALSTSLTAVVTISPATAGSTIVVVVHTNTPTVTVTVDDTTNGAYTRAIYNDSPGDCGSTSIHYKHNVSSFTQVRAASSSADSFCKVSVYEISGLAASAPTTGSTVSLGATSHPSSASGLSGTGFSISGAFTTSPKDWTAATGTGFTQSTTDNTEFFHQYKFGTITNDTATFTSTAAANTAPAMAVFAEAVVVAGLPFITQLDSRRM